MRHECELVTMALTQSCAASAITCNKFLTEVFLAAAALDERNVSIKGRITRILLVPSQHGTIR